MAGARQEERNSPEEVARYRRKIGLLQETRKKDTALTNATVEEIDALVTKIKRRGELSNLVGPNSKLTGEAAIEELEKRKKDLLKSLDDVWDVMDDIMGDWTPDETQECEWEFMFDNVLPPHVRMSFNNDAKLFIKNQREGFKKEAEEKYYNSTMARKDYQLLDPAKMTANVAKLNQEAKKSLSDFCRENGL